MTMRLADLQKSFGDSNPLIDEETLPEQIDLESVERKPDRWQPKWIVEKYFEGK